MTTVQERRAPPTGASRRERRAAVRAFRPRRAVPAIATAAVLAAATILAAIELIAALFSRSAGVLPVASLARLGRQMHWDDPLTLTIASAVGALGLVLLTLALLPGRPRAIALACDGPGVADAVVMGITPLGMARQVAAAAEGIDWITHAKVNVGHRRIKVRATSPLRDTRDLHDPVRRAVADRVEEIAPMRTPRLRITVRHRSD